MQLLAPSLKPQQLREVLLPRKKGWSQTQLLDRVDRTVLLTQQMHLRDHCIDRTSSQRRPCCVLAVL